MGEQHLFVRGAAARRSHVLRARGRRAHGPPRARPPGRPAPQLVRLEQHRLVVRTSTRRPP